MSKVLRAIVDILLILFVLIGLALYVPPVFNISTSIGEDGMTGNLQTGWVAYGMRTPIDEISNGDKIVYTDDEGSFYIYNIVSVDQDDMTAEVTLNGNDSEETTVDVKSTVQKHILTVPFIGYMSIAMQTQEGMIILGLTGIILVALFIVMEVWCRKHAYEEEDTAEAAGDGTEDDADEQNLSRKELRKREKAAKKAAKEKKRREKRGEGEEDLFFESLANNKVENDAREEREYQERKAAEQETQQTAQDDQAKGVGDAIQEIAIEEAEEVPAEDAEISATNGPLIIEHLDEAADAESAPTNVIDTAEIEEKLKEEASAIPGTDETGSDTDAQDSVVGEKGSQTIETDAGNTETGAVGETGETAAGEGAAEGERAMPLEAAVNTGEIPSVQAALEAALETQQVRAHVQTDGVADILELPDEEGETAAQNLEEIELAIPVKSVEEFLQEAYTAGDDPIVEKDEVTGITFIDYSDCL